MIFEIREKNVFIEAALITLGKNVSFGRDVCIKVRGQLIIGDNSFIGDRFKADAEDIFIGEYFYNKPTDSRGMIIGGGGSNFPFAKLRIGKRCVCHTGHINLARPIELGDDVGLSHDVDLITHGFWYSVLDGFPAVFDGITLGNNVILGWKSIVMPGVKICDDTVIGAHSIVTKSILAKGIYAGTPAKFIRGIETPSLDKKYNLISDITDEFEQLMSFYETPPFSIDRGYPILTINKLKIDLEKFSYVGDHDAVTDAFRDFLRRYGIRVFAPQGFVFNLKRKYEIFKS